jgi:hypothetical protein
MSAGVTAAPHIVADLHPPRLPAGFIETGWQDLVAAFGIGLLLAAVAVAVIAPLLKPRPRRVPVAARLARLAALPPDARLLGQLALLRERGAALPDDVRAALYGRTPPDPERLDELVRRRGRR